MIRATISADIIASSALFTSEIAPLTQGVFSLFEQISEFHSVNAQESPMCRLVSGDTIECLVYDPQDALRIALIIKVAMKSFTLIKPVNSRRKLFENYGARVAIGIGEMDVDLVEKDILKGDAINRSGRLIAGQKTSNKERVVVKNTLFFDSYSEKQTEIFHPIMSLLDVVINRMTRRQSVIMLRKLFGDGEQSIATKLGISQSSVNQHSTSAGWGAIEDAIRFFEKFDFQNA